MTKEHSKDMSKFTELSYNDKDGKLSKFLTLHEEDIDSHKMAIYDIESKQVSESSESN